MKLKIRLNHKILLSALILSQVIPAGAIACGDQPAPSGATRRCTAAGKGPGLSDEEKALKKKAICDAFGSLKREAKMDELKACGQDHGSAECRRLQERAARLLREWQASGCNQ